MNEESNISIGMSVNINKIAYYSQSSKKEICTSYLSRTIQVSKNDFLEYGMKLFVEKSKYNDTLIQNLFDKSTLDIIGKDIIDLENKCPAIFPTVIEGEPYVEPLDRYFGLTVVDNIKLILLSVRVQDISDKLILYNSDKELESIPLKDAYANNENNGNNNETIIQIFITNNDSNEIKVNLSKKAWVDDYKNPLRNLKEYYLRNDDLKLLTSYINPINNIGYNRLVDTTSGTLISCDYLNIESLPIFNEKRTIKDNIKKWEKSTIYNFGDEVLAGGEVWKSLSNFNEKNYPLLSDNWERKEDLTNYYNDRIFIDFENYNEKLTLDAGKIYPSKEIVYSNKSNEVRFFVDTNPGITINPDHIFAMDESGLTCELEKDKDFKYQSSQNYENLIVFDRKSLSNLRNFEKLILDVQRIKLSLNILFYILESNNGIEEEIKLDDSEVRTNLSVKYTDIINEIEYNIALGDDRDAAEIIDNKKIIIEQDKDSDNDNEYSMKFDFISTQITESDYSAKVNEKILEIYHTYPAAYIQDIITIDSKGTNINIGDKTYTLDYLVDNSGNRLDFEKDKELEVTIIPEAWNEINPIMTYKIFLSEPIFDINITNECSYVILEKTSLSVKSSESGVVRFYYTDDSKTANFKINGEELSETTICDYEFTKDKDDGICSIIFSNIKEDLTLEITSGSTENENK